MIDFFEIDHLISVMKLRTKKTNKKKKVRAFFVRLTWTSLTKIPRFAHGSFVLFFLCLVFVMLSRLFIAALWSPAGKRLTSWLLLCGTLGQVWYLIVFITDLCGLSYFDL